MYFVTCIRTVYFHNMYSLCLGDPLPGHQHVQHRHLLDVVHRLLVRHHGEIISIQLEYLVVDPEARFGGSAIRSHVSHIDTIVLIAL